MKQWSDDVNYREESKAPKVKEKEKPTPAKATQTSKKKFCIECRWLKTWRAADKKEWNIWKRYDTQKKAEEAFKNLKKTHKNWDFIEFRMPK